MAALEKATNVGVTIDLWSTRQKSYLGETIHWFDESLNRKSACLAIRRVKGSHTFDVLGRVIEEIHLQFNIVKKLSVETTDNGSNFLKAFREFGSGLKAPTDEQLPDSDSDSNNEDDIIYISLGDIFDEFDYQEGGVNQSVNARNNNNEQDRFEGHNSSLQPLLPPTTRCACHLLNLVSKTDVEKIKNHRF